ncbi:MAG: hypothetical protein H7Y31_03245 [Chitinophagaceae bacterium]|nr:hypothetical protein [Chitinophagaceae bacterium]
MKKIFTLLLITLAFSAGAQQFNNEWIRFNQTYYKLKVGTNGVYRISKSALDAAGLGNTQVQFFELWRNGQLVPFYPSVSSGTLPADGFIEFYGILNDGKPDNQLYRDPAYQHSTALSLVSDSSTYFLSVNVNQSGFMMFDGANDVASNTLPAEPYFMYTAGMHFQQRMNQGFAAVVGEYVFSSSYDKGEYWSSFQYGPGNPLNHSLTNLAIYPAGPGSTLRFGASGNALNPRSVIVSVNGTVVKDTIMDYFNDLHTNFPISTALLTPSTAFRFQNNSSVTTDRMVVSYYELTYPRSFDFGAKSNFEFVLPADNDGYYLEITNFAGNDLAPILYDQTFGTRYIGDISTPGKVKFALPASTSEGHFVLASQHITNIRTVNSLAERKFTRFAEPVNQGDYLIVTHPLLNVGTNGRKPVDEYAAYRSSPEGGSFNVKVVDVNELADQFSFGIKNHPLSVRNFIRYTRANFSTPVKNVFLVGRGMTYNEYRMNNGDPLIDKLNLVPTFGAPASDNMLSAGDITVPVPLTPIGRLSVVIGREIEDYLEKVIEYETTQRSAPNTLAGREWMKNVVHVTGASDPYLGAVLCNYMGVYKQMIEDTLFGARVSTFCKATAGSVEQINSQTISHLFSEGISILTYFGHSSSTTLEFNLDNPNAYNNVGKYPVFFVNGCNAGNFYTYYPQRFEVNETLSEKFVLAKQRGSIAFMASTHFGIVNYLNIYLNNLYTNIGKKMYGLSLGEVNKKTLEGLVNATGPYDYYARMHAEEITLHGDPALKLNVQPKPDYVIEEPSIKLDPSFVSIAVDSFRLKVRIVNIGKAVSDSVTVQIKRQYPDGSSGIIYSARMRNINFADSLILEVPIVATRDKGLNRITATIDSDSRIDEMDENNNSATKEFFIYEDEARPIFPYNYSIVSANTQKLYASTANPFSIPKDYILEIDTTEKFNSALKFSKVQSSPGGILEFSPTISYLDSTVYYWRVALVPVAGGPYNWNHASFVYINGAGEGFNQSHFFQHQKSQGSRISIDSATREWKFGLTTNSIFFRNGMYPTSGLQESDFSVSINNENLIRSACVGLSIIFNIIDPITLKPWRNVDANGVSLNRFGSAAASCGAGRFYNFEFQYTNAADRKKMMDFMDSVPVGHIVTIRSFDYHATSNSDVWRADTAIHGSNKSIYHKLLAVGFTNIDSLYKPRVWVGIYKKGDPSFATKFSVSQGVFDAVVQSSDITTPDTLGIITSPVFGPAKAWTEVIWRGYTKDNPSFDQPTIDVIGIDAQNNETVLYKLNSNTQNFDLSAVPAEQFPYMKLRMHNLDSVNLTPFQLKYWRIMYQPVPEGAVAANIMFSSKDTLDVGEPLNFALAFKNISHVGFDSIKAKLMIIDQNNVQHIIPLPRTKPLVSGDTVALKFTLDTKAYPGNNTLYLEFNPDNDQKEQYHFNNFVYRSFYVKPDKTNPLLDVTFDGVHILNRDIVSARPHIVIKLKDEAKFLLMNDTALSKVQVRFPDGTLRSYAYDNDTLRFTPAANGADNTASIDFTPQFLEQFSADGDEYELIVKGKDRSNNAAGEVEYRVSFKVISKPMISNMLNYPNPFSTSTAFVFTITGSEVPQNIKIQILTVTGKIVREITKDELGPLHIGRNITEFKWDGTDQYGQKVGNGVYLYRVVTTLNGKRMDKYRAEGDNTDKYFNNGYGKMYLMR